MGQVLQYSFKIPEHPKNMDDNEYLVSIFIQELIKYYQEHNYLTTVNSKASGGQFLLGYNKRLYCIENEFQIIESSAKYHSCGSGMYFALGSLHTTEHFKLSSKERITMAIKAASDMTATVGGRIQILKL